MSRRAEIHRIGFVGLGAMGVPMACNLLARGFGVTGYDVRADAVAVVEEKGGLKAPDIAEVARGADALILMVVNAAQAESVLFDQGAVAALPPLATVILMSTCPPAAVERLGQRVVETGRLFVDAPVSGGVAGATAASLTIMAAAPLDVIEHVMPVLTAMGSKVVHVGEKFGQGAMVKTVNQLLCGVHLAVAAEALSLANKAGISPEVFLDVLGGSAASSWMLRDRGPRMVQTDPVVTSAVDIFVKDLDIVLAAGREAKAALPLAAAAHQMFLATSGRGDGAADDSQVVRAYNALNAPPHG